MSRSRFLLLLSAIGLVGLIARIVFVEVFSPSLHFGLDTLWYELTSSLIVDGRGLSDPAAFFEQGKVVATAFRVPLYPTFLAGVSQVANADRHTFQIAGCLVGTGTVVLTGVLGRQLVDARVGLVAAAITAFSPALVNVDASVMSETLQVPLVTVAMLLLVRAWRRHTLAGWALAGLVLGFAMLNRSDALVVVATLLVVMLVSGSQPFVVRARSAAVLALAALVVVAPWMIRNNREVGTYALSTIDSAEAVAGANCDTSYTFPRIGLWDARCRVLEVAPPSEVGRRDALVRRAREYAMEHWTRAPLVAAVRGLRVWGLWDPLTQSRDESDDSRNTRWQLVTWAVFLATLGVAARGFVLARRRGVILAPFVALFVAITVGAMATYGKQRLRVVAEPEIAVLAAIAIVEWWTRRVNRTSEVPGTVEPRSSTPSPG